MSESVSATPANSAAGDAGFLRLFRCEACGALHSYPRAGCPKCGGATSSVPASGRGTVYSYTIVHRAPTPALRSETPYVIVIVRTAEGPHVMGRLEGPEAAAVHVGMDVLAAPPQHAERGYFAFIPAAVRSRQTPARQA